MSPHDDRWAHRPDRPEHLPRLPIFDLIQKTGGIPERDMYNTFNMGIGMILALPAAQAGLALSVLKEVCTRPPIRSARWSPARLSVELV